MKQMKNDPVYIDDPIKPSEYNKTHTFISGVSAFVVESIEAVIIALALCIILYLFVITPHEVLGNSMVSSFEDGEYLIADKVSYRLGEPQRGDVVIFRHSATQDYIKRVIGLPGEVVSLRDGKILINGELLPEDQYLSPAIYTNGEAVLKEGEDYIIPEGEFFVLGDNRQHSSDSRAFGSIEKNDIKGRAWVVYFPFNRFRVVEAVSYE